MSDQQDDLPGEGFTLENGIWYYERAGWRVANVRGRGETKEAAYKHWRAISGAGPVGAVMHDYEKKGESK